MKIVLDSVGLNSIKKAFLFWSLHILPGHPEPANTEWDANGSWIVSAAHPLVNLGLLAKMLKCLLVFF